MKLSGASFLLFLQAARTRAHIRLECPPSRTGETGAKVGPCDAPDDLSLPAYPLQPGAFNTITWLESIAHPGAPSRMALSLDGDDSTESFESCLLLDHIPHDEYSQPVFSDETSWHRSSITVWIPDVYCERCHLQFMIAVTNEVHGVPLDTSCAYSGAVQTGRVSSDIPTCPYVYHSCSPVSINGTRPRNELTECNTAEFEEKLGWPMKPTVDEKLYDYSTYYYKGDPGVYNISNSRLMKTGAPIKDCPSIQFCDPAVYFNVTQVVPADAPYASMEGTCAAMVDMEVEPFALGVLPTTPKVLTAEDLIPPSGEADPCDFCGSLAVCYTDACPLRDAVTGVWAGQAAVCNAASLFCESCFPDSACHGFGTGDGVEEAVGDSGDGDNLNGTSETEAVMPEEKGTSGGGDKQSYLWRSFGMVAMAVIGSAILV